MSSMDPLADPVSPANLTFAPAPSATAARRLADTTPRRPSDAHRDPAALGGRYALGAMLGCGATSTVFQAHDTFLNREVAVKVFRTDTTDLSHQARRHAEMQLLAGLSHPGLVTVFDGGTETMPYSDARTYLVMELVSGPTLKRIIARGPIQPLDVAHLGAQLADALAYIHAKGIIHRDVKPANILLTAPDNRRYGQVAVKLSDFGIARLLDGDRLTMHGMTLGTANYLSPEQATGGEMDLSTDVYSLGLVLLECLTGHVAYPGTGLEAVSARLQRPPSIPDRLGPSWSALLTAMTATEPGQRPTAFQVAHRLTRMNSATAVEPDPALTTLLEAATTAQLGPLPGLNRTRPTHDARGRAAHRPPNRRWQFVMLAVTIAAVATVLLIILLSGGPAPSPAPSYPSVPGQLGTHLRNLQQSVQQ